MKVPFLKLLIMAGICFITTTSVNINGKTYAINRSDTMTTLESLSGLNIKFFLHDNNMIVAQLTSEKNYNFVEAVVSENSLDAKILHGKVELYGLKPNTKYENFNLTLKDDDGNMYNFKINSFETPSSSFLGYSNVSLALNKGKLIAYINLPQDQNVDEIKSVSVSDSSINVEIIDNAIVMSNFENGKTYSDLNLIIVDKNDNLFETKLNNFHIPADKLETLDIKVSSYKKNYIGEITLPNGITVLHASVSDKNIVADTVSGEVTLLELKPETTYEDLILTVVDDKYKIHIFELNKFSTLNKNFSYADAEVRKDKNKIDVKILLPDDLKISNAKISDTEIKFEIKNNELILKNLPSKTMYSNLKIIVQDTEGKLHNFVINEFSTSIANVNLEKLSIYIENAYKKAFNRNEIDKDGFEFWIQQLSLHKIGGKNFILNILETDEFIKISKEPRDKILRIYEVMFSRTADIDGLKYWIDEYNKDFEKTKNEKESVSNIVKSMCNSIEFNRIISELGIMF